MRKKLTCLFDDNINVVGCSLIVRLLHIANQWLKAEGCAELVISQRHAAIG